MILEIIEYHIINGMLETRETARYSSSYGDKDGCSGLLAQRSMEMGKSICCRKLWKIFFSKSWRKRYLPEFRTLAFRSPRIGINELLWRVSKNGKDFDYNEIF